MVLPSFSGIKREREPHQRLDHQIDALVLPEVADEQKRV
jgi:hypothetical protein